MLQKKPANPAMISFASECFRQVGTKVEYIVLNRTGAGYPRVYASLAEAEAARSGTQEIVARQVPVMERIKWF